MREKSEMRQKFVCETTPLRDLEAAGKRGETYLHGEVDNFVTKTNWPNIWTDV